MQLKNLPKLLPQLWSAETSASPQRWSTDNPALGQCAVTAALVQEIFGGRVVNCMATLPDGNKDSHYANSIRGRLYDFTASQFPAGTNFTPWADKEQGLGSTRNYALSLPVTLERYALLRKSYQQKAGALPRHPWLLIDLDDTLIVTQPLYDSARKAWAARVASDNAEQQEKLIAYAAAMSRELVEPPVAGSPRQGFGYSRGRFPAALLTTLLHFRPDASNDEVLETLADGRSVFNRKAELKPWAHELMSCGKHEGYRLGIITQGDSKVQRKRLAELPFMSLIDSVLVVPRKTPETFATFIEAHGVDASRSWMVGDSLDSDIAPAAQAGLRTIHFQDGATKVLKDKADADKIKPTHTVSKLTEILRFT
jgi:putative hydrolase of the HAD superfamily